VSGGAVKRLVPVVLAHAASTGVLVFYLIPLRLVDYLVSFVVMLGYPVTAYLANLNASHNREEFLTYWYQVCKVLQIVSFAGPAMLLWIGEPFIRRWMGPEIADGVGWPLVILTLPLLLLGVASNANRTLQSLGKHGPAAKSALVLAPVTVGLAYPLGVMFGVNGVCIAVALFSLVQGAIELVLSCRALGVSTVRFTANSMRLFVLPVIVLFTVFGLFRLWRYPTSYGDLLVECLVAGSFYLLTTWYCAFDRTERGSIFGMVDRYRNKAAST
jgi:O-antigen/teichoic acid export membrane protein